MNMLAAVTLYLGIEDFGFLKNKTKHNIPVQAMIAWLC
jgi:hypothetical protein